MNIRPKSLALTVLVDWSNQDKTDSILEGLKSACHPCWLCVHFGPPPNQAGETITAGQWQLTINVYSVEKTPLVKKQNEEPIPKERRAVLWHGTQPFDKYRYGVVQQHCRFPPSLTPRVIAFHADRAEPDVNALVWVRKSASLKRHKQDSYLKVVRGHIYHLHFTFPDGSLVNQYIAQGWGFTASLFTYKRRRGQINVSPSRAVTQIRANWLDMVEPDPEPDEIEASRQARIQEIREDAEHEANEKANKRAHGIMSAVPGSSSATTTAARTPCIPYQQTAAQQQYGPRSASTPGSTPTSMNPYQNLLLPSTCGDQLTKKRAVEEWTIPELNHIVWAAGNKCAEMPDNTDLKHFDPVGIDLRPDVDTFVDTPFNPPSHTTTLATNNAPLTASASMSSQDKELLTVFRSLEQKAKVVAIDTSNPLREVAVRLCQVLSASGQLGGWRHVEEFMADQEAYHRKHGPSTTTSSSKSTTATEPKGKIELLMDNSVAILRAAFMRAKWVLEVEKKAVEKAADGKTLERILGVLLKDGRWMNDTAGFLKSAEQQVSGLIGMNPALFAKFRDVQSRGVQWPHSPNLRRQIERAGFMYRPMMIKRDRCVCDACGVEVSGWRLWHNPWLMHDWTKRHPFAPPPGTPGIVARSGPAFTSAMDIQQ